MHNRMSEWASLKIEILFLVDILIFHFDLLSLKRMQIANDLILLIGVSLLENCRQCYVCVLSISWLLASSREVCRNRGVVVSGHAAQTAGRGWNSVSIRWSISHVCNKQLTDRLHSVCLSVYVLLNCPATTCSWPTMVVVHWRDATLKPEGKKPTQPLQYSSPSGLWCSFEQQERYPVLPQQFPRVY